MNRQINNARRCLHRHAAALVPKMMLIAVIGLETSPALASVAYDFVQDGSGSVLATLELSSLPARHTEVVGLTFTAAGNAIFGLGQGLYSGSFDATLDVFADDGLSGLAGTAGDAFIVDGNPPLLPGFP